MGACARLLRGAMLALVFACIGSAYGTGKAGMGISHVGVSKPEVKLVVYRAQVREGRRGQATTHPPVSARSLFFLFHTT